MSIDAANDDYDELASERALDLRAEKMHQCEQTQQ